MPCLLSTTQETGNLVSLLPLFTEEHREAFVVSLLKSRGFLLQFDFSSWFSRGLFEERLEKSCSVIS